MAYTDDEQRLYDHIVEATPPWFTANERRREFIEAVVKVFARVLLQQQEWNSQTRIREADRVGPDWLAEHAHERGTWPQEGESDDVLRARLRSFADAVTPAAIMPAIQGLVDTSGVAGTVEVVELKRHRAWFRTSTSDSGVGGTFAIDDAGQLSFAPSTPFAGVPRTTDQLVLAGAADAANDGSFDITGLAGAGAEFTNAAAVAGADAAVSWTVVKRDADGNVLDGFRDSYLGRGYRLSKSARPASFVIILPYGSTAGTAAAVEELLRLLKAGGFRAIVERRTSP